LFRKVEAQSEPVKDGKKKPIRPNLNAVRGGRNARTQANLIQSNSIFEAGPAESTKRCDLKKKELKLKI